MSVIAVLALTYSAMAALCLGMERHAKQFSPAGLSLITRRCLRAVGWVLLLLSFYACIHVWGWSVGTVAWFGFLTVTSMTLVLLLPYAPRLAGYGMGIGVLGILVLYAG